MNEINSLTIEEINSVVCELGYTLNSVNIENRNKKNWKVNVTCENGHTRDVSWISIVMRRKCRECYLKELSEKMKETKYSRETIERELLELGYFLDVSTYISKNKPLTVSCKFGHNRHDVYYNIIKFKDCPECNGTKHIYTIEDVKRQIETIDGIKCRLISTEYKGSTKPMEFICDCGEIFETTFSQIKHSKKRSCNKCSRKEQKNTDIFKEDVFKLVSDEYVVIGDYINNHTKIKIKHMVCNTIYETKPNVFLNGCRCPICKESKVENKISTILDELNAVYVRQYSIEDCKHINALRFDFAIFKNNNLSFLCEYDGEFHFLPLMGQKDLDDQIFRDNIKNEYCKNNNIKLVRIPYWEKDKIETIIKNEINRDGEL